MSTRIYCNNNVVFVIVYSNLQYLHQVWFKRKYNRKSFIALIILQIYEVRNGNEDTAVVLVLHSWRGRTLISR